MSLTLAQGSKFLKQIVGGTNTFSNQFQNRYLGLSSTPPSNTPDASGNYNITEPNTSTTSYRRVLLEPNGISDTYFPVSGTGEIDPITQEYVISISNTSEIHFNEATTNWGTFKWFAIFATEGSKEPLYFGELITEDPTGVEISANTVPLIRTGSLKVSVK